MRTNFWRVQLRPHLRLIGLALLACCLAGYLSGQAAAHRALFEQQPVATKDARPALATPGASQPQAARPSPSFAVSNDASHKHHGDHGDHGGHGHGD